VKHVTQKKSSGDSDPTTERRNVWTWQNAIADRMFLETSLCSFFMRCRYTLDYSKTHANIEALVTCLPEKNLDVAVPTLFRRWSDTMWDSGRS